MSDELDQSKNSGRLPTASKAYREMVAKLSVDQIVIERREVIDTITLTSDGASMPDLSEAEYSTPLVGAFALVATYLDGNLVPDQGMSLEFKYGAHTFRIAAEFTG